MWRAPSPSREWGKGVYRTVRKFAGTLAMARSAPRSCLAACAACDGYASLQQSLVVYCTIRPGQAPRFSGVPIFPEQRPIF